MRLLARTLLLAVLGTGCLLAALAARSAAAEEPAGFVIDLVSVMPEQPNDVSHTMVALEGGYPCDGDHGVRGWQLQGSTIRIEIEGVLGCVLSPPMYEPIDYDIDLGRLAAGSYQLEVWVFNAASAADPPSLDYRAEVQVVAVTSLPKETTLATVPTWPSDTRPLLLVVSGDYGCGGGERLLDWRLEGDLLSIDITGEPFCEFPVGEYPFAVPIDVGILDAGQFHVEIWVHPHSGDPLSILDRSSTLQVFRGLTLTAPAVATTADTVQVTIAGNDACPSFGEPRLDGQVVTIPKQQVYCIVPVGDFSTDVELPPLPAGDVRVELRDYEGSLLDSADIQVLQDPVELADGAFRLDVDWTTSDGTSGRGRPARPPSNDSALYWFFAPDNWELMVKVLDGCAINGHYWVFAAAATDVQYTLRVEHTGSGDVWQRSHPGGTAAPALVDTAAFVCD